MLILYYFIMGLHISVPDAHIPRKETGSRTRRRRPNAVQIQTVGRNVRNGAGIASVVLRNQRALKLDVLVRVAPRVRLSSSVHVAGLVIQGFKPLTVLQQPHPVDGSRVEVLSPSHGSGIRLPVNNQSVAVNLVHTSASIDVVQQAELNAANGYVLPHPLGSAIPQYQSVQQ